ncbi:hypothetical protein PM082_024481 [Marasmius tenuissimus]|nr:hypothetical protein PM082_024481 [Marasmius tenuissimus]
MDYTQPKRKRGQHRDSALDSDAEFQPPTKKPKPKSETINCLLARANQSSFHAAEDESKAGYRPSQATSKKSTAAGSSSRKGKARAVPETFAFGRVFVFPDGCKRKKVKGELEFVFKSSSSGSKPTPSPADFEKARQRQLAAVCDMKDGPWNLPLDLEADDVLDFLSPFLPNLIQYLHSLEDVPNKNFVPGESPEHQQYLPQLIPLVSAGRRGLEISAGALEYPTPTFAEYLCRLCPDRSKGKDSAINHTLYFVTHSAISQDVLQSWGKPSKRPLPASQSYTQVIEEEHDSIADFSSSGVERDYSSIDNDGMESDSSSSSSDVSSANIEVVAAKPSHKLRKHKPVTEPVTYISTNLEDRLGGGSNIHSPGHVHNPPTYNNTDTEQEDIEVSAMFHSMASVSEHASLPLVAMNDSTIIYDPYKGYIPDVRF